MIAKQRNLDGSGLTWSDIKDHVVAKASTRVYTWGEQYIYLLDDGRVLTTGDVMVYPRSLWRGPELRYFPIQDNSECLRAFKELIRRHREALLEFEKIDKALNEA